MGTNTFKLSYINDTKKKLGYQEDSLNINIQNNAASLGKTMLFGYLSLLSLKSYNLSFEPNGLLLIQRSSFNNRLLENKVEFIDKEEIDSIFCSAGLLQDKLTIVNKAGKSLVFKIQRKLGKAVWQQENLAWLEENYGKK